MKKSLVDGPADSSRACPAYARVPELTCNVIKNTNAKATVRRNIGLDALKFCGKAGRYRKS
jgi:hypothetical protein